MLHFFYLDDFPTIGPPGSADCGRTLYLIIDCRYLGIPLALEKEEGPATMLDFLGITLDTVQMEAWLPDDKLSRIRNDIRAWLGRKTVTKREILSLVGMLQHAGKVVRGGRTFNAQSYYGGTPSSPTGTALVFSSRSTAHSSRTSQSKPTHRECGAVQASSVAGGSSGNGQTNGPLFTSW